MTTSALTVGRTRDERAERAAEAPVRRLLVLVPPEAGRDAELAEQAWRLAVPEGLPVVLVGLAHDGESEAQRRRQLAGLAALTRDEGVAVTTSLALEPSWVAAVRRRWQPGDLIVCFAGQRAPHGWLGLGRQPLAQALQTALPAPLHQAELAQAAPDSRHRVRPMAGALALVAALAVIAGCFLVQVQVVNLANGLLESGLLAVSVAVEFGMLRVIGNW